MKKKILAYLAFALVFYASIWLALVGAIDDDPWMVVGSVALYIVALAFAGYAGSDKYNK